MKTLFLALAALSLAVPAAQAQMNHASSHGAGHAEKTVDVISGTGAVNAVDPAKRTVNVSHAPISALGWPNMTMDFAVAEDVDLTTLKPGDKIAFTLSRGADNIYMIDGITAQ